MDSLEPDAAVVDAVVSTVGFPLVGGPAGSMKPAAGPGWRRRFSAKNVPYVVGGAAA